MFGDIIFSTLPFAVFDSEVPEPYSIQWINQCPTDSEWDTIDPVIAPTTPCEGN